MAAKLTYFNLTGLGEPVRLMLSAAKIPFKDKRVSKKDWEHLKPKLKWPHLPMLEIHGKTLFQSMAICRNISRKAGLAGADEEEDMLADATVDALEDVRLKVIYHYYKVDSPEREQGLKDAKENVIPLYMKNFNEQVEENDGYMVKGKCTWADIIFFSHAQYMCQLMRENVLADYPSLEALVEKVKQVPGIKEYIQSRPDLPVDLRETYS